MPYYEIIWNEEPDGNVEHIAEHGVTPEDVEEVLFNPVDHDVTRCEPFIWLAYRLRIRVGWTIPVGRVRAD